MEPRGAAEIPPPLAVHDDHQHAPSVLCSNIHRSDGILRNPRRGATHEQHLQHWFFRVCYPRNSYHDRVLPRVQGSVRHHLPRSLGYGNSSCDPERIHAGVLPWADPGDDALLRAEAPQVGCCRGVPSPRSVPAFDVRQAVRHCEHRVRGRCLEHLPPDVDVVPVLRRLVLRGEPTIYCWPGRSSVVSALPHVRVRCSGPREENSGGGRQR
mmetsp:Transcript_29699/g.41402  ORF Transcript_29699/g.41402 Transcript_29699/m.41402 type:complete len:211 (+) Transcript_29699:439-1071(+)